MSLAEMFPILCEAVCVEPSRVNRGLGYLTTLILTLTLTLMLAKTLTPSLTPKARIPPYTHPMHTAPPPYFHKGMLLYWVLHPPVCIMGSVTPLISTHTHTFPVHTEDCMKLLPPPLGTMSLCAMHLVPTHCFPSTSISWCTHPPCYFLH